MTAPCETLAAVPTEPTPPWISYELFPPRDDPQRRRDFWDVVEAAAATEASFVTVTYGALGSSRDRTLETVRTLTADFEVLGHATLAGHTRTEVLDVAIGYAYAGAGTLLVRGDPRDGGVFVADEQGYRFVTDAVADVRHAIGEDHCLAVGVHAVGHPESKAAGVTMNEEAKQLAKKGAAGACMAVTQVVWSSFEYQMLRRRATKQGWRKPIVPGICVPRSVGHMRRLEAMSGTHVPPLIADAVEAGSPAWKEQVQDILLDLCEDLLGDGTGLSAPGVHLFTMNDPDTQRMARHLSEVVNEFSRTG